MLLGAPAGAPTTVAKVLASGWVRPFACIAFGLRIGAEGPAGEPTSRRWVRTVKSLGHWPSEEERVGGGWVPGVCVRQLAPTHWRKIGRGLGARVCYLEIRGFWTRFGRDWAAPPDLPPGGREGAELSDFCQASIQDRAAAGWGRGNVVGLLAPPHRGKMGPGRCLRMRRVGWCGFRRSLPSLWEGGPARPPSWHYRACKVSLPPVLLKLHYLAAGFIDLGAQILTHCRKLLKKQSVAFFGGLSCALAAPYFDAETSARQRQCCARAIPRFWVFV